MTRETTTWTPGEASPVGDTWDALALARPGQGDPYATHAWFDAWVRAEPRVAPRVAVHAVLEDGVPVAIWPLVRSRGTWSSTNVGNAPRTRLVLGTDPDPDVVDALVEQVQRRGARHLRLHGLPSRDPGTDLLLAALRRQGFAVDVSPGESDNVVPVAGSESFDKTFRKLVSSTRSRERRVTQFWDVETRTYGGGAGPLAEGMDLLDEVQARSWKGPHQPATARRRRFFLESADRHGWVQLLVLTIAGRPAAGNVWFRLGDVAVGWSTCYDQQLAALAPGLLLHRQVQEAVRDEAPALLDVLPGPSPFKDSLDVDRPPLLTVEAHRGAVARVVVPTARWARRTALPAARSAAERAAGLRRRDAPPATPEHPTAQRVTPRPGGTAEVTALSADPAFARYLAVARGLPSADAAASGWGPDDRWLLVDGDRALARLGPAAGELAGTVREVVPLRPGVTAREVAQAVADSRGAPVALDADALTLAGPPPLPWVAGLATSADA